MFVLIWLTLPNYAVEEWLAIQCNYACPQTQMVIPFTSSSKYHDEKEAYERKAILSILADAYRYVCEVPDDAGLSEGFYNEAFNDPAVECDAVDSLYDVYDGGHTASYDDYARPCLLRKNIS